MSCSFIRPKGTVLQSILGNICSSLIVCSLNVSDILPWEKQLLASLGRDFGHGCAAICNWLNCVGGC